MDAGAGIVTAVDGATIAASAFNAAYLAARRLRESAAPRRTALAVLATLSAGIGLQSAFSLALYLTVRWGWAPEPFFEAPAWVASRIVLLAGVLALSLLVLRRRSR